MRGIVYCCLAVSSFGFFAIPQTAGRKREEKMKPINKLVLFCLFAVMIFSACHPSATTENKIPAIDSTPIIYNQINGDLKKHELDTFFRHRFVDGKFSGSVLVAQ